MIHVKPADGAKTFVVACLVALTGCEGARWQAAQRAGTVSAYRGFLARHPHGGHAAEASQWLEQATYRAALRADRPLGYRQYLEVFPAGRFATEARERLGRLALARAQAGAELELVVERYGATRAGRVAAQRLVALAAQRALQGPTPAALHAFLERYPQHPPWTARVREALAGVEYARSADDPERLLAFARRQAGTRWEARADRRLAELLVRAVRATADPTDLAVLTARFPNDPRVAELERLVSERQRDQALATLDLRRLRALARYRSGQADPFVLWCTAHRPACSELAARAAAASPWRPVGGRRAWQRARTGTDPLELWVAAEALGWSPEAVVGERLAPLAGSARLVEVWSAAEALGRWIGRLAPATRERWLRPRLPPAERLLLDEDATPPDESANAGAEEPGTVQRTAVLALLGGDAAQRRRGRWALRRLAEQGEQALAASFLLLSTAARTRDAQADAHRFARAAAARVSQLEQVFPLELLPEAEPAATLAERELFVIGVGLALAAPDDLVEPLRRRVADLLAQWQLRLARAFPDFRPARAPSSAALVAEHEAGRQAALDALLRRRDPAAKELARAICAETTRRVAELEDPLGPRGPALLPPSSSTAVETALAARCRRPPP